MVRTEKNATVVLKSTCQLTVAVAALDFGRREFTTATLEMFEHEFYGGVSSKVGRR